MTDGAPALAARFGATPPRFALYVLAAIVFVWANGRVGASLGSLIEGLPQLARVAGEMLPPDLSRIRPVGTAILETLLMALVGSVYGALLGFALAIPGRRSAAGRPRLYWPARALVSFFRTVPDLVWAVLFVVAVGLGPFAGALAIAIDTAGFCGRFFAEAMEEVDPGPEEALRALGATPLGILFSAVVPAALPAFVNVAMFSLEKAVRASVVLGLVGAGGIGIELKVAMDMFQFGQATTIILLVFGMVLVVEQLCARVRAACL
jgi:phosphonate transport system permease protein